MVIQIQKKLDSAIATVTPDSLACLIFTSGTTGKPKGVMISHKNVLWTIESLFGQMIPATKFPRIVSYLPMAHIAARAGDHYQAIYRVGQIFPVPVLEDMRDALPTIKPSVFLAVPRVWERFKGGLQARIDVTEQAVNAMKEAMGEDATTHVLLISVEPVDAQDICMICRSFLGQKMKNHSRHSTLAG